MKTVAILFAILTMSIPCAAIDDPVGHWELDEGSGLTAYDSAGSNDGTLYGNPVWTTGQVDGALEFDGIDDYVEMDITNYKGVLGTQSRTCTAWIKTTTNDTEAIIGWGDPGVSGALWLLHPHTTGTLRVSVLGGNIMGSVPINDGNWNHVAAVFQNDGTPNVEDIKLYVNGIKDTNVTVVPHAITTGTNYVDVFIGTYNGKYFDGRIDDVRIYGRVLSAAEVEQIYFEGLGNLSVTPNEAFSSSGDVGGPFAPASKDYQLTNIGEGTIWWDVQYSAGWLDVSETTGVLDPNEYVTVTVSVNATADTLLDGLYTDTLVFRDTTNPVDIVEYGRDVTLGIGADVPYQYPTIQSAINASSHGDTIVVAPGTYYENINFGGKNITLTSMDPSNQNVVADTVIDGNNSGSVVTFSGSETSACVLTGFTITNGEAPIYDYNSYGGGIYGSGSTATISNCVITGNSSSALYAYGGGLADFNGLITNCTITGNSAVFGGGLYRCDGAITNCTIVGNSAVFGGGLRMCDGAKTNCIIWGNTANYPYDQLNQSSTPTYSCIQNWIWGGIGNITNDPLFADTSSPDPMDWDLHLKPWSHCIDGGANSPPGGLPATGLDGNPRPIDGNNDGVAIADMGIYEATSSSEPVIWLSDLSSSFFAEEGGSDPAGQILTIHNAGGATLNWTIVEDCNWLTVFPTSGSSTGEPNEVMLSVDITGMTWGQYSCDLTITDPLAENNPQVINIVLYVTKKLYVPSQYTTIQAAINAAATGDTVVIAPGTYTGTGNREINTLGKAITVRSIDPTDPNIVAATVIDGQMTSGYSAFYIDSGEGPITVIEGLTIKNFYGSWMVFGAGAFNVGSAFRIENSRPTIRYCVIRDCTWNAMLYWFSDIILKNCIITNNLTQPSYAIFDDAIMSWYGGGYGKSIIENCTIANNYNDFDGGNVVGQPLTFVITNSIFRDNIYSGILAAEAAEDITVMYSNFPGGYNSAGIGNIEEDPLFADPANYDYHLKSQAGRWNPNTQSWVTDAVTSLCIDTGNPGSWPGDEYIDPNNVRINIGAYGRTKYASKTPANWGLLSDMTNDGFVDNSDLAAQAMDWQQTENDQPGDLDRSGTVDLSDLILFINDWLEATSWH